MELYIIRNKNKNRNLITQGHKAVTLSAVLPLVRIKSLWQWDSKAIKSPAFIIMN
jgi:hypothetical protein